MEVTIRVYGEKGETVKECKAETVRIKFGVIEDIFELIKPDTMNDSSELIKRVYVAFNGLVKTLKNTFPDMTDEDWREVDITEMADVIWGIIEYAVRTLGEKIKEKNAKRA